MADTKRTPDEWQRLDGVIVIDPDGWRHDRKTWSDPITYEEWQRRMSVSTVGPRDWGREQSGG